MIADNKKIPALDGLRGLSCLAVVYLHFTNPAFGFSRYYNYIGFLGVMMFFTLSGFLMAYLYMPGKLKIAYWKKYITRRFFRIYPLFVVALLVTFLISLFSNGDIFAYYNLEALLYALPMIKMKSNSFFWTIFVEMRFYIIFPFIACAIAIMPISENSKIYVLLYVWLALLLTTNIKRHGIYPEEYGDQFLGVFSGFEYMVFFSGGMYAGLLYKTYGANLEKYSRFSSAAAILFIAIILFFTVPENFHHLNFSRKLWPQAPFYSFLCTLTVLSCALSRGIALKLIDNPLTNHFGKISYSLFLLHVPILVLCNHIFRPSGIYLSAVMGIMLSWAIANLSYEFIEKPMIKMGRKLSTGKNG